MDIAYLPYLLLLSTVLAATFARKGRVAALLGLSVVAGLLCGALEPLALLSLALVSLAFYYSVHLVGAALFVLIAGALFTHQAPGFHNLLIFDKIQFSPDALPFTMYLNFDKTFVGILVYAFGFRERAKSWLVVPAALALLVVLFVPALWLTDYARFDAKWPDLAWLWMLNNLFFVCLAEEGLFRGFIQGGLTHRWPTQRYAWLVLGALLFGAAHYQGGLPYVAFASVAGLFYGFVYLKTRRLEAAMLVHFGLNLIHFLLFTYPALNN